MGWVRDCFSHIATLGSRPESSGRLYQQCYLDPTALGINAWLSTLFKIVSAIAMVHLEEKVVGVVTV